MNEWNGWFGNNLESLFLALALAPSHPKFLNDSPSIFRLFIGLKFLFLVRNEQRLVFLSTLLLGGCFNGIGPQMRNW